MPSAPTPVSAGPAVPDSSLEEPTFDAQYEEFYTWEKDELAPGVNALADNAYDNAVLAEAAASTAATMASAAQAAASGAGASAYVPGEVFGVLGTHPGVGDARYSLVNFQSYRRTTAGTASIDPASDPTNWKRISLSFDEEQTLADGATINWDAALGNIATVTLGGNRTLAAPTNLEVGSYILTVIQDGTGNRTLTLPSIFETGGGAAPVWSTAAGAKDVITAVYRGGKLVYGYMRGVA